MKNYLIESMASYMDKMEKPMPQRKRLNESKKVLSERFSNIVPDENDLSNYLSNKLANNVAVGTIETHRGRGYTTFIVHLVPEQYDNNGYGYSFDFVPKEHKYVDSFYDYILQTLNRFITEDKDESLTEARNPENDEVNATIRKWANNGRLSKKDKEILDKNGLFTKSNYKYWPSDGRTKAMTSASTRRQLTKGDINNTHPDYDLAGNLNKKKLGSEDIESDLSGQALRTGVFSYDDSMGQRKDNGYKVSRNQLRSLQPYAHEKHDIKRAKEDRDYYSRGLKSAEDRLSNIKNSVKDKHNAKKKNESLLKEDMNTTIVTNIVDWLADHETAWEDCCNYFGVDPDSEELYNVDKDELLDWVSEHKQLSSDLLRHWGAEWAIQESYKRNRKLKESFNYGDKLMSRAIPEGLYDEICRLLTDYENPNDAITPVTIDDFYDILVDVANYSA